MAKRLGRPSKKRQGQDRLSFSQGKLRSGRSRACGAARYLAAEKQWNAQAPRHVRDVIAANSRNASKHGRLLFFQHRYVEDAAELYLRTLQEHLVHELPKEGVTLVTGCGSQAQLDRVIVRLAALKGSVVDDFYLWPPAQRGTLGAVQTTVLRPHSGPDSNAGF
ncbi:hypothetical protein WJX79_004273 [Trebouxia sp. C0005]